MKIKNILENKSKSCSVCVIAEMAWSHDGSAENAKKIIEGAARAGADAVSFHVTDIPSYMVKDFGKEKEKVSFAWQTQENQEEKTSIFDYLEKINLEENDWRELFSFAKELGLEVVVMPNDDKSLELCERLEADIYVIGAACFVDEEFIKRTAEKGKPVILRIGGANFSEIEKAVSIIKKYGKGDIVLLHGIQLYPTKTEELNLSSIPYLREKLQVLVGLADHIDGDSDLAFILPLLAIPLGANVIEKHLTYDRSVKGEDYEAALNPEGFKKFVEYIREAEKTLGVSDFENLSEGEIKYRELSRKRIVARRKIEKGEEISRGNIAFKRSTQGLFANETEKVLGKKAAVDIKEDEAILIDKVQ